MTDLQQYQQTLSDYAGQLRGLFTQAKGAVSVPATMRGMGGLAPDVLAARARQLVASSQKVGEMTASLLNAPEANPREAAELKLLAQATAQVEVAQALLETADEQTRGVPKSPVRGGIGTAMVQQSLNDLATVLEAPVQAGVKSATRTMRGLLDKPKDLPAARAALQTEVNSAVDFITRQAAKVGGEVLRDLLLLDASLVMEGVALVSKDAAQSLDQLIAGAGKVAMDLASSAVQLLLQAYNWVLALIGQDTETAARKQVGDWVDKLRSQSQTGDSAGPFAQLVDMLYVPKLVKDDVAKWLPGYTAEVDKVNQAADTVKGLADKYKVKTEQVEKLSKAVALVRKLPALASPQGQALAAAVNLGLIGYVLYTGYDHVDSGNVVFFNRFKVNIPSRVNGVRKTVAATLGVTEPAPPSKPAAAA
ncbi:MAG: hypothetical protein WCF84_23470 [Anaerolineae bacterium]